MAAIYSIYPKGLEPWTVMERLIWSSVLLGVGRHEHARKTVNSRKQQIINLIRILQEDSECVCKSLNQ